MSEIKHSAVASWSGFIYQGLCGLHYALHLINTQSIHVIGWKLNFEAYEDFSILDDKNLIVSLHQCKCYNEPNDFTNECQKMCDKEEYWKTKEPTISPSYKGIFFHTNQTNKYSCGITSYQYNTSNTLCNPVQIQELIQSVIDDISRVKKYPGSSRSKSYRLISIVSKHIGSLHEKQISTKQDMFAISRSHSISFSVLVKELEKDDETLSVEERAQTCRHYIALSMKTRLQKKQMMSKAKICTKKIDDFLDVIFKLDTYTLTQFIRRIFPDIDILSDNRADLCVKSVERANSLFTVIDEVNNSLTPSLSWNSICGDRETPSTILNDRTLQEICYDIITNPYSNDIKRDYRWIVGNIFENVDDIESFANIITKPDGVDFDDITQPRKVGLLDINTKNNGNY